MTRRQTALVSILCTVLVFAALATVLHTWQAIGDALVAGLGCAIGTDLFMHERVQSGELISRPIIAPVLHRTLYLCQLTTRPPTVAREVIHDLIVQLVLEAVASGAWPARVLDEPPR